MVKKIYMTPVVEVTKVKCNQLLMSSGVNSVLGIGYGGVDTDGILDATAPDFFDFEENDDLTNSVLQL